MVLWTGRRQLRSTIGIRPPSAAPNLADSQVHTSLLLLNFVSQRKRHRHRSRTPGLPPIGALFGPSASTLPVPARISAYQGPSRWLRSRPRCCSGLRARAILAPLCPTERGPKLTQNQFRIMSESVYVSRISADGSSDQFGPLLEAPTVKIHCGRRRDALHPRLRLH